MSTESVAGSRGTRPTEQEPAEHEPVKVSRYLAVFGALLVLTLITVGVSHLHLPITTGVVVALAIATLKAGLVAMFFMHLKGERPMVFGPLALTAVLFFALILFVLWTEGDHLFGTRFTGAFEERR
jgi:cytochrome c oxidase subunit 4